MRTVSPEELTQLLAAVNRRAPFGDQDYWLIVLAANTGLRVSELHGLNVHDVVWQGRPRPLLVVPKELGKGRKSRAIPLNARAREAVAGLLDFKRRRGFSTADEAPLFVIRTHTRMSVRTIEDHIQQLRQAAGLEGVTPHSFRHSFVSRVVSCGASLVTTQALAGHARVTTLQVYAHTAPDQLAAAVQAIE
jgi:integrase/recombinase XerD